MVDDARPPMALVDLGAHFIASGHQRYGMGLSFFCPVCYAALGPRAHRYVLAFANPMDSHSPFPVAPGQPLYERHGDDIINVSLRPSIHDAGHWHGRVDHGVVFTEPGA